MDEALKVVIEEWLTLAFWAITFWIVLWSLMRPSPPKPHEHRWGNVTGGTQRCLGCGLVRRVDSDD